jgi:hypothetical protein
MIGTGYVRAALLDASGVLRASLPKTVKVSSVAEPDPNPITGLGPMKVRAANNGTLEIKSLHLCTQSPQFFLRSISYIVDGELIMKTGLTPGNAMNPYMAVMVNGVGSRVDIDVTASNGDVRREGVTLPQQPPPATADAAAPPR